MKISDALKAIESFYIPGCVAWWDDQNPNRWQIAHDEFEKNYFSKSLSESEVDTIGFLDELRECTEIYKSKVSSTPPVDLLDAGILSPEKMDQWDSVAHQCCYVCQTTAHLVIEPSEDIDNLMRVVCKTHKNPRT